MVVTVTTATKPAKTRHMLMTKDLGTVLVVRPPEARVRWTLPLADTPSIAEICGGVVRKLPIHWQLTLRQRNRWHGTNALVRRSMVRRRFRTKAPPHSGQGQLLRLEVRMGWSTCESVVMPKCSLVTWQLKDCQFEPVT